MQGIQVYTDNNITGITKKHGMHFFLNVKIIRMTF